MKKQVLLGLCFCFGLGLIAQPPLHAQYDSEESVFTDIKLALEYKGQVKHLNLSKQKLKKIPIEVFLFPNLRTLNLSGNKIETMPKELGFLTKLEELDITKNKIDELPKEIGNLKRLRVLKVRSNALYSLPKEIGELVRLETADFNDNPLWRLPEEFKLCANLKFMDIRNTDIDKNEFSYIKTMFPSTEIFYTDGCNCGPGN